jgi:rhodanese-related sulfurtransferase
MASIEDINEISVHELKFKLDNNENFVILDVRGYDEYADVNLEGSILIPLPELESRLDELDKDVEYVVHCKLGGRSARAVALLQANGFENVVNLAGGITAWAQEIDPHMRLY